MAWIGQIWGGRPIYRELLSAGVFPPKSGDAGAQGNGGWRNWRCCHDSMDRAPVLLTSGSAALGYLAIKHMDGRVRDLRELTAGLRPFNESWGGVWRPCLRTLSRAAESVKGRAAQFFNCAPAEQST